MIRRPVNVSVMHEQRPTWGENIAPKV